MIVFADSEGNTWEDQPDGLFRCVDNPKYGRPVTLTYLAAEFGPLAEVEGAAV